MMETLAKANSLRQGQSSKIFMIEYFKRLSSQTLIYGLGDAIIKAIAILLIPLYTKVLTTDQVGDIALLNYTEMTLLLVLTLGLASAVFKFYHEGATESERRRVFSTATIFSGAVSAVLLAILFGQAEFISQLIFKSAQQAIYLKFIFGSVLFNLFRQFALAYARAIERPIFYSFLNIVHFLLLVGLNLYYILVLHQGVLGVVKSSLYSAIGVFMIATITVFKPIGLAFSRPLLGKLLHFGLPMVPGAVASFALTIADRYLLNWYGSADAVGRYDIVYKFGMIINMLLVTPFRTAWLPFIFSVQKKPEANKIYAGALTYFLLLGTLLFLIVSLFAREIILLFSTRAYLVGLPAVPLVALAYIFYGLFLVVDIGVLLKVKTFYYTVIYGLGALINIGLNIIFIPRYGMMAAAVNTTIAYFITLLSMCFVSQRLHFVPYEWQRILKIVAIGSLLYVLGSWISFESTLVALIVKFMLILCYPVLLYWFKFFRATEIAGYKKIILETINRGRR